ncbi:hypothetical protein [Stutzerimonas zhaodongensis]|uniref:hypothetical protein n=1 Tax=Stutzerimonas TaxID=2901164 RepID=UPI0038907AD4
MNISTITASVLLALLTTTASAAEETTDYQSGNANIQTEQDLDNEASAHGYQNPTGEDPQPRLNDDTIENAHGDDRKKHDEADTRQH